jgi:AmmeMemoRadiSam system protein B
MSYMREPAVSGTFYPGDPKALRRDIERYMDNAVFDDVDGAIVGLISPHAGFMYSGPVAAYGYKALQGSSYDTVVVVAPSHRAYFQGAAIQDKGGYKTPFGVIAIDEEISAAMLRDSEDVINDARPHAMEHSLEVQLPFLQVVLKTFKLVPLVIGVQDVGTCERLADRLWDVLRLSGKRVLIVGSTDLSHYHPYAQANKLDNVLVDDLEKYDLKALQEDFEKERFEACGYGPIIITMMVSKRMGATKSKVLKYLNSGDTSGDKSGVVGYVSSVFNKPSDV